MRRVTVCSVCGEQSHTKMASFYWAWTWPTGDRKAYKQVLDFECSTPHLRKAVLAEKGADNCIACGVEIPDREPVHAVWLTMYLPGKERQDYCLLYHPSCFERNEPAFTMGAKRLPERQVGAGGPPPPTPGNPWDSWEAMGIEPA